MRVFVVLGHLKFEEMEERAERVTKRTLLSCFFLCQQVGSRYTSATERAPI
jgi:hypothetical protein